MALEFAPGESVSVTRRLTVAGESEYLLNNRACRLRDHTGFIFRHGIVRARLRHHREGAHGQILSAKPMDAAR